MGIIICATGITLNFVNDEDNESLLWLYRFVLLMMVTKIVSLMGG